MRLYMPEYFVYKLDMIAVEAPYSYSRYHRELLLAHNHVFSWRDQDCVGCLRRPRVLCNLRCAGDLLWRSSRHGHFLASDLVAHAGAEYFFGVGRFYPHASFLCSAGLVGRSGSGRDLQRAQNSTVKIHIAANGRARPNSLARGSSR